MEYGHEFDEDVQVEYSNDDMDEDVEILTEEEDELTESTKRSKLDSHVAPFRSSNHNVVKLSRKYKGAAVYKSKFQSEWQKKWPCITPVKSKPSFFYCTVCSKSTSCGHQGERDVTRHMASVQYK